MNVRPHFVALLVLGAIMPALAESPAKVVTFADDIYPIFREHCLNCHNADKKKADLDISSYEATLIGSSAGEIIEPSNADASILYQVMAHTEEPVMPPKKPRIPEAQLQLVKRWIDLGVLKTKTGKAKKSERRQISFDIAVDPTKKPDGPAPMPEQLPEVSLGKTHRPHPVTAMATSPWAPLLAVSGHERILLYHTDTLEPLGTLPFPERIPYDIHFSRNGRLLIAAGGRGGHSGKAVLYDVIKGTRVAEIGDELDIVLAADVSADHRYVALGGPSKIVKIFSTDTGEQLHKIKKHTDWVTAIAFSPDGKLVATGDRAGGLHVWEPGTGGIVFSLLSHKASITDIDWRSDSQLLATSSEDGNVVLWDMEDGFPTRTFVAQVDPKKSTKSRRPSKYVKPNPGVQSVAYASNGTLITTGRDKSARIWNGSGSTQINKIKGFTDLPTDAVFTHDGKHVITGDFEGNLIKWEAKSGERVAKATTNP